MTTKQLSDLFIKTGRPGISRFAQIVKQKGIPASMKQVNEFYKNQEVNQLTKKAIIKKDTYRKITGPPLSFQMDVVKINKKLKGTATQKGKGKETTTQTTQPRMQAQARPLQTQELPKSHYYSFLLFVDITTKKAYIYKLPATYDSKDVIETYEKFLGDLLKDTRALKHTYDEYPRSTPMSISTDDGFGEYFKAYNAKKSIPVSNQVAYNEHITKSNRLGVIDRLVRTIKFMLTKRVFAGDDILPIERTMKDIVRIYNDTGHTGIENYTPNEAFNSKDIRYYLYMKALNFNASLNDIKGLEVGDTVRIYEMPSLFEKETARFSKDIYTIATEDGLKYRVMDKDGVVGRRQFKPAELQKVNVDKIQNISAKNMRREIRQQEVRQKVDKELRNLQIGNVVPAPVVGKRQRRPKKAWDE